MTRKLIMISIPSSDPKKTAALYSSIFGVEFARSFSETVIAYHVPISEEGILFQIQQRFKDNEGATTYFAVTDLKQEVAEIEKTGAKRISEEHDMKIADRVLAPYLENYERIYGRAGHSSLGKAVVLEDGDGHRICLMELHEHAHPVFKIGKHLDSLTVEHLTHHSRTVEIGKLLEH